MRPLLLAAVLTSSLTAACDGSPSGAGGARGAGGAGGASPAVPEPPDGRLKIEEVYYAGSPGLDGAHYFSDQLIELVNVSDVPIELGGLHVGDVHGLAGEINPGDTPSPFAADEAHVYLENLWRIPGAPGDTVLAPGASFVIAQDGRNHAPFSTVDLSDADMETYNEASGDKDEDYPTAPNLEKVHYSAGFDWLITVFGPSVVVLRIDDPAQIEPVEGSNGSLVRVPAASVIDAVEALRDAESGAFKRLPASVDSGFAFVSGTYTGESLHRRRAADGELVDTGDSGADFEVGPPAPRGEE